jgi:hypothetical protein
MDIYTLLEQTKLTSAERKLYDATIAKLKVAETAMAAYRPQPVRQHPEDFSGPREKIGNLSDKFVANPSPEILGELAHWACVDSALATIHGYCTGMAATLEREAAATLAPIAHSVIDRAVSALDAELESTVGKLREIPGVEDAIRDVQAKHALAIEAAKEEKQAAASNWKWLQINLDL